MAKKAEFLQKSYLYYLKYKEKGGKMAKKEIKKRYWAFVCYPESLPGDWLDTLQLQGIATAISPLHDKDVDPTGEAKKPHYHVILVFNNSTTYLNVKSLCDSVNGTIPIHLESVRGMYRYLTHKDNPDKHQYQETDIIKLNGFDYDVYVSTSEILEIKKEILNLIAELNIVEYRTLVDYCHRVRPDYLEVVCGNTIFWKTYLDSKRNELKEEMNRDNSKHRS